MKISVKYADKRIASALLSANLEDKEINKKLSYEMYDYAKIVPDGLNNDDFRIKGGVLTADDKYVINSAYHECELDIKKVYPQKHINMENINTNAIYIGQQYACWGHAITDNLTRLWFLFSEEGQNLIRAGYKIILTTIFNEDMPKYVAEILNILKIEYMHIRNVSVFQTIIIPHSSLLFDGSFRYYTPQFQQTIFKLKGMCENGHSNTYRGKYYFSRSQWKPHIEIGEKSVEQLFAQKGYKIVIPEKYNVIEQINMITHADAFAATEGSVAHISIFANPNTKVQLLMKANYINSYQCCINQLANLDVEYININHSVKAHSTHPWWGPFYLFKTRELIRWANIRGCIFIPHWLQKEYYKYTRNKCYIFFEKVLKKLKRVIKII